MVPCEGTTTSGSDQGNGPRSSSSRIRRDPTADAASATPQRDLDRFAPPHTDVPRTLRACPTPQRPVLDQLARLRPGARDHAARSARAARYRRRPPLPFASRPIVEGSLPEAVASARIDWPASMPAGDLLRLRETQPTRRTSPRFQTWPARNRTQT